MPRFKRVHNVEVFLKTLINDPEVCRPHVVSELSEVHACWVLIVGIVGDTLREVCVLLLVAYWRKSIIRLMRHELIAWTDTSCGMHLAYVLSLLDLRLGCRPLRSCSLLLWCHLINLLFFSEPILRIRCESWHIVDIHFLVPFVRLTFHMNIRNHLLIDLHLRDRRLIKTHPISIQTQIQQSTIFVIDHKISILSIVVGH